MPGSRALFTRSPEPRGLGFGIDSEVDLGGQSGGKPEEIMESIATRFRIYVEKEAVKYTHDRA